MVEDDNYARRTPAGRRWKRIASGLLAAEIALTASPSWAESKSSTAPGTSASARLAFKIVIPSILVVDTRTGTIYSNDARGVPVVGTFATTRLVRRDGVGNQVNLRPSGTARNAAQPYKLTDGDVIAIP